MDLLFIILNHDEPQSLQYVEFFTFAGLMFLFSFALMAVAYRSFDLFIYVEFRVVSSLFMTFD